MKRIVQLADFHNSNIGDMIAIDRVRRVVQGNHEVEWIPWHVQDTKYNLADQQADALVIGGGGLIEGGVWNRSGKWKWKLPFDSARINKIDIPIYVMAVGLNFFRSMETLNKQGVKHLSTLIKKSRIFSVRDDGSLEALHKLMNPGKVEAIPPLSCFMPNENLVKTVMTKGFFNPAVNCSKKIMMGRNISIEDIQQIAHTFNLPILSHGPKDHILQGVPFCNTDFNLQTFDIYNEYDYALVMKGHGQIVAYAKNLPNISLATQDKVHNFAVKHGFGDYMVDTKYSGWKELLQQKMGKLTGDSDYLAEWYALREVAMRRWKDTYYDFYYRLHKDIWNEVDNA